jgi:hypothetical protein
MNKIMSCGRPLMLPWVRKQHLLQGFYIRKTATRPLLLYTKFILVLDIIVQIAGRIHDEFRR